MKRLFFGLTCWVLLFPALVTAEENCWTLAGDSGVWSRVQGAITFSPEPNGLHNGKPVFKVVHTSDRDWAVRLPNTIPVKPGEIYTLQCDIKTEAACLASTGVILYAKKEVYSWCYGGCDPVGRGDWKTCRSEFIVPPGATHIEPRMTGSGKGTCLFANYTIKKTGFMPFKIPTTRPVLENKTIKAEFNPATAAFKITDKRTSRVWQQDSASTRFVTGSVNVIDKSVLEYELLVMENALRFKVRAELAVDSPELSFSICGDPHKRLGTLLHYPPAIKSSPDERVILPLNEGISYPVEHERPSFRYLYSYGGHGLCMGFFGQIRDEYEADKADGWLAILETSDDAGVFIRETEQVDGRPRLLYLDPYWDSQKGLFGYDRSIRYVFFDKGGHVALCKRYRRYAQSKGLYVPFTEKVRRNPNLKKGIDMLVGAANIWCWTEPKVKFVKELQAVGIDRILWSGNGTAEEIRQLNAMDNVLTSRYDIYQDLMDPALVHLCVYRKAPGAWPMAAWPHDVNWRSADGTMRTGWSVDAIDKTKPRVPCVVLCDKKALPYAEKRISEELKTKPFTARFIDTTVAAPWLECYNPDHPMTRSDSRVWKMKLLELLGKRFNLVCGSETGHEASVPYCDFFEGMMSLGPYRVPESGRYLEKIWDDPPERTVKYQVGEAYRLPLWELVYHDCTVAYWYWGDYNNKLPKLWRKRDLFNALYGTPPMYLFPHGAWKKQKEQFVASYKVAQPVSRLTGYSEMTNHRILTKDRTVQQTEFANGYRVTVNFGTEQFTMSDGSILKGDDLKIEKIK